MSSNVPFGELLEAMWDMDIAKNVNKLLVKMGVLPLDIVGLRSTIDALEDADRVVLVQALKNKDVDKIVSILGIPPELT